uniref:Taxi A n=1 Tax=Mesoveloidea williamsi TaxID=1248746 RepID=A0A4Q8KEX5_9HEMI|nr:taxi A [Mesoveloidea williamsi]
MSALISDANNNETCKEKSYSLRPRSGVTFRRIGSDDEEEDPKPVTSTRGHRKISGSGGGTGVRPKRKSVPLSKYKRKNANARERCRMREINEAFESLRRAIPSEDDK